MDDAAVPPAPSVGAPMVRPARSGDIPAIAELYHRVWHETHAPHMPRAECIARDAAFFLRRMEGLMPDIALGEANGVIAGFAAWQAPRLGQLFLDARSRGSGLARRLIEAAERSLLDRGTSEAELHYLVGNGCARRFYERAGWHVTGVATEAVAGDAGRDFWVMRKPLHVPLE